jgi:thioredoxin-like negative regulator of GroEL
MPCKTVQRPALAMVQAEMGDKLKVIEVDATQRPELADSWGVLSVPTTFIIDTKGRPRKVNHGVVRAEKLLQQLTETEAKAVRLADEERSYT